VASTPARLVLDLMAPDGASGQGVTLTLTASGVATWHAFSPGVYLQGLAYPSPLVNVSSVQGSALRIVAAQAPGTPVLYGTAPVLKVALDLVAGAAPGSLTLSAAAAGHLGTDPTPVAITIVSGSLLAQ